MTETLAMIERVGVGGRDVGRPVLWFDVVGDGWGSLQVMAIDSDEASEILSSVYDVRQLNGRMCVVDRSDKFVSFKRLLKPAETKV